MRSTVRTLGTLSGNTALSSTNDVLWRRLRRPRRRRADGGDDEPDGHNLARAEVLAEDDEARQARQPPAPGSSVPRTRGRACAAAPRSPASRGSRSAAARPRSPSASISARAGPCRPRRCPGRAGSTPRRPSPARALAAGKRRPARCGEQDVRRPARGGDQHEARPTVSMPSAPPGSASSTMPAGGERDPHEVEPPARAEHGHRERPDELDRHRDAERDAVERLVEREVHQPSARPNATTSRQVAPRERRGSSGARPSARTARAEHEAQHRRPRPARGRRTASPPARRRTGPTSPPPAGARGRDAVRQGFRRRPVRNSHRAPPDRPGRERRRDPEREPDAHVARAQEAVPDRVEEVEERIDVGDLLPGRGSRSTE